MKGIIFNLAEEVVAAAHGPETWDALLEESGASGAYTSLGSYPDSELIAILTAASARLGMPVADVLRWFGRSAMPLIAQRFPAFFTGVPNLQGFILSLNTIIHAEVRKLYAGATCPHFDFALQNNGQLHMTYHSPRQLCALVEGFVTGAADHFGETVTIDHGQCTRHGAPACTFLVHSAALPAGAPA